MRRALVLIVIMTAALATANSLAASSEHHKKKKCHGNERCEANRTRHHLVQKWTPEGRWAIPGYIVECESHGNPHALNQSSGAGGAYQALPSTWRAYRSQVGRKTRRQLRRAHVRLKNVANHTKLVGQHIIARLIWLSDGPGAWSCS